MAAAKAFAVRGAAEPRPQGWDPGTGNGSLMRTGPVCLPFLGDQVAVARAAQEISDLTHADEYSGDSCVLWSLAIESAIVTPAGFTASQVTGGLGHIPQDRRGFWEAAIQEALTSPPATFWRNGSAVAAFKCALSAVAHSTGLEDGLQIAVAAGNDTDTVASIAGALLGAMHGASAVPAEWRARVHGWPGLKATDLEGLALTAAGIAQEMPSGYTVSAQEDAAGQSTSGK